MSRSLLQGIRVLDMTQIRAGPKAAKWLADAGAEVIKVESRARSDNRGYTRRGGSVLGQTPLEAVPVSEQRDHNRLAFEQLNRNKLGLAIDLSKAEGIAEFKKVVAISDVVMENFSFGVMERLGLGYNQLRQVRPDIIMISMPGFGDSGPYRDNVSFGWAQEHMSGLTATTGYSGGPPMKSGTIVGDPLNGTHAVGAIMSALLYRVRTGAGQFIDFAHLESLISLVGETVLEYTFNNRLAPRIGNRHPVHVPQGAYPCRGVDNWVSISVTNDQEWTALCGVIDRQDLAVDPRFRDGASRQLNQDALDPLIAAWTIEQERDGAMELLQAAGVPAGAILDQDEALTNPQAKARGFLTTVTHPDGVDHPYINTPAKFSRTPAGVRTQGPLLGEHNSFVLGELLGLPDDELQRLEASGITATFSTDVSGQS